MSKVHEFNAAASDKPVVVLSCANGFPPESYERSLRALYPDFRVIAVNMRPLWDDATCAPESLKNWTQLADDLLSILDTVTNQPVYGIGHSVGGVATVYAAIKQPQRFRKLALIDPTFLRPRQLMGITLLRIVGRADRLPFIQGALRRRRQWESKEAAYEHLSKRSLFKRFSAEVMRDFINSTLIPDANGGVTLRITPEWEAQIFKTVATDVWTLPQRLKQPTLVIRGELTDVFTDLSVRLFQRRYPQAQIETVAGIGHLVPHEAPDQVGKLLHDYLMSQ
ncbi:MAG: alpha/beta hydrolase [Anaerolineae bacterium]|nr:alpha/beta hydrolase [Anaerolineae bacterium]